MTYSERPAFGTCINHSCNRTILLAQSDISLGGEHVDTDCSTRIDPSSVLRSRSTGRADPSWTVNVTMSSPSGQYNGTAGATITIHFISVHTYSLSGGTPSSGYTCQRISANGYEGGTVTQVSGGTGGTADGLGSIIATDSQNGTWDFTLPNGGPAGHTASASSRITYSGTVTVNAPNPKSVNSSFSLYGE